MTPILPPVARRIDELQSAPEAGPGAEQRSVGHRLRRDTRNRGDQSRTRSGQLDAFDAIATAQSHDEIITILYNLNDNAAQLVAESQPPTAALRDEPNSHRPGAGGSSLSIGTSRGFTPGGRFESA
jgi:hypothetical protein